LALLLLFLETRLGELPILRTEEGKKRWEQENMLMIAPNSPAIFFRETQNERGGQAMSEDAFIMTPISPKEGGELIEEMVPMVAFRNRLIRLQPLGSNRNILEELLETHLRQ